MACSEARLAANRANALKSTGPRTEEGRAASRRNALKHGLTGGGVVIPGEDAEAIDRQAAGLLVELAPDGPPIARELAGRVATLIVRLKRSARHEFAATRDRCLGAALDFDEVRQAEAERLFESIDEGSNRDDLLAMPEGVDLLDETLLALRAAVEGGRWTRDDTASLIRCLPAEARAHADALGRALVDGDLSGIDRGIVAIMEPGNVQGMWARDQVVGLVEAERAELAAIRPTLDVARVERLRHEAINLVLVDAGPEAVLARRYEAATERSLYRAIREIRELRRPAPADPVAPPPPPFPFPTPAELVRQADEMRRNLARVDPAATSPAPAMGSFFPAEARVSASPYRSKSADADPAPRGQSRHEDRSKRPKIDR